jgi:hypothetical protein
MNTIQDGCIYGTCRARNLCKQGFCVGANLKKDGYVMENGEMREMTDSEKAQNKSV